MPDDSRLSTIWNKTTAGEISRMQNFGDVPTVLAEGDGPPTRIEGVDTAPTVVASRDAAGQGAGASAHPDSVERPGSRAGRRVRSIGLLRRLRSSLASGVGRRLMVMFIVAGLVPVLLLAGMSFVYVSRVLHTHLEDDLTLRARQYGASLYDRLLWAEAALRQAAIVPAHEAPALAARVGREFTGVSLLDRQGRPLQEEGLAPRLDGFDLRSLDPADARRATALLATGGRSPAPVIVHAVGNHPEIGFIAATIRPGFLWGESGSGQLAPDRCVLTLAGQPLACPPEIPAQAVAQLAAPAAPDGKSVVIDAGRERLRASPQPFPGNDRFLGADLLVAALLPESQLTQPMNWFYTTFLPAAALAVLLVSLIGYRQVRRILLPLRQLLYGMQRVARRDFGTPVPVTSRDEFGQMARSFNKMSAELGLHFRTLSAFSEIDRTILTTVDMRQVADIALACIHEISGIKVVSLGLLEADSPGTTQVYLRAAEGAVIRDALPRPLDLSNADSSLRKWSKSIRLPANYRALLHRNGAKYLYLLPIARADKVWGVVVLGHDQKTALSAEQALALAGVIDRLAVALSSVARDKQLHDQAHFDSLTGLPNRHYLMDMLAQQVRQARREAKMLAVLYIDLDRFKRTNDTLGHAAGDVLLRKAAARIRRVVREGDIVARLGGDEFTVVLNSINDIADAGSVARALIAALNEPFEIEGHVMYAGGSVGISIFPKDGDNSADLLKKADTALYLAKDRGRGRYAFFEERMNADASARVTIDRELREALRRGEFVLYYQPQIDLATGRVCAVEALLRWQHPERGLLAPEAFIDHAEDSGLIEPIGNWVLREACHQHRRWAEEGVVIPRVSINVSAVQLRNASFAAVVEGALTSSTTSADHLEIEVTESLLVDAGPDAVAILQRLRERGVEIAVDDFGTGYSSFAYVKQLPANVLKLDRTFIVDVIDNPQAAIIATAIMEMAAALGKTVVAEGVETLQQVQFLRRNRCMRAQGYVFCHPLPPEEIPAFVREREHQPDTVGRNTRPMLVQREQALNAA